MTAASRKLTAKIGVYVLVVCLVMKFSLYVAVAASFYLAAKIVFK
jgi:hypothetical protein